MFTCEEVIFQYSNMYTQIYLHQRQHLPMYAKKNVQI